MGGRLLETMNAFNFFDKIYCINLPEDEDRRLQMENIFSGIGIEDRINWKSAPRPFDGYGSSNYQFPGEFGVVCSQLKVLVDAASSNLKNGIVVFEDDVRFIDDTNKVLNNCMRQLPNDWDILYLGGTPEEMMTRVDTNVCRVNKFIMAMSYAVSAKCIKDYVQFYIDRMGLSFPDACCDNILNDFIVYNNKKGYACTPPIAWDIPGWSTLRQGDRNYSELLKKAWNDFTPKT